MKKSFELIAAPFTPFTSEDALDEDRIHLLAKYLQYNNLDGAFIAGTTGECASLSHKEKIRLQEIWSSHQTDSFRIISMLGGTSLPEMQDLAQRAQSLNLSGISIISPYYFKSCLEELVATCHDVCAYAPNTPFYYYHLPQLSGARHKMLDFIKLAEKSIPTFAGIKFSAPDMMDFHLCRTYSDKYKLFWGSDEVLLSAMINGADGAVGSTYNYAAPLYQKIIHKFQSGDIMEAREWQERALKMVSILVKHGGISAGKLFMKIAGLDCGKNRRPLANPTTITTLKKELEKIDFNSFCNKVSFSEA